ncbi:MAG: Hint domain-containing protein [Bacteroidales bacterium]
MKKKKNLRLLFNILLIIVLVLLQLFDSKEQTSCLVAGTKIRMGDNTEKNIEDIKVGDYVLTLNPRTKRTRRTKVLKVIDSYKSAMVSYVFKNGRTVTATQDHPFLLNIIGWGSMMPEKTAKKEIYNQVKPIQLNSVFIHLNKRKEVLNDQIQRINHLGGSRRVYSISKLSSANSYIANGYVVGVY